MSGNKTVAYYYDSDVGFFHYGAGHPMKPFRIHLTHDLVIQYGLYRYMTIYRPRLANFDDFTKFHSQEYVDFLRKITPDNGEMYAKYLDKFRMGPRTDCPIFYQCYEFNQRSVGGSIDGALKLAHNHCDIAINWSGGFHHAKKSEASGFCYINDIVLAIVELLKYYQRVLYIDIDVHHGDGVEEAFYTSDRVLTLSLHNYEKNFFPGTGNWTDIGAKDGRYCSVNYPFSAGIDDDGYMRVYKKIINEIMAKWQPNVIVLQCGADSLAQDRIGVFNLTTRGHGSIVSLMKSKGLPMLVIGGGGYTIKNVARCWTYETSLLTNKEISENIPYTSYINYYKPDFKLHVENRSDLLNKNTKRSLDDITNKLLQQIDKIEISPSVEYYEKPADIYDIENDDNNNENENDNDNDNDSNNSTNNNDNNKNDNDDMRNSEKAKDLHVENGSEFYEDDNDQDTDMNQTKGTPIKV